ncbi:MAG: endo-1,4-beta-xylanase [Prevotella sp.]|nr:endo-1,4-beta-xylanase [Prevotella sp.]
MKILASLAVLALTALPVSAQHDTIDISGNNTSSSYVTYEKSLIIPAGKTVDVMMARYTYFNSNVSGKGTLALHAGGERCYLGTAKGASYPDWTRFTGDVHVYPFKENSSSAGYYGIIMAHGGKTFSVEDVEGSIAGGKVNKLMEGCRLTLHDGATLACESGTRGFRFGELQTEAGSTIMGYMKKNTYNSYFLMGCLGTDAVLAGTIAPPDYSDQHKVGLLKEGSGTYRITGNNNFISGALRVLEGKVLVMNDREEARTKKLRGATGGMTDSNSAVALVFEQGLLGGTGHVGGTVDNYGVVEPGDGGIGTLVISDYANPSRQAHLCVRPASVLRFKVRSMEQYDQLLVGGTVKYYNIAQDFSVSDKMPVVEVVLDEEADVKVGDEFTLLHAQGKTSQAGAWQFDVKMPERYTWELVERELEGEDHGYELVLRLLSLEDAQPGDGPGDDPHDNPYTPWTEAFYNDGINDVFDKTTIREYAERNGKHVGTAISTWKTNIASESLSETKMVAQEFNMLVAENEMKYDALEPSRGSFSFGAADNLVDFAQRHQMEMRGHCLVWHSQLPEWVSSDGKKNDKNWSRQEALDILNTHITKIMTHFKGKVKEWDVVNECLDDNQTTVRSNPEGYDLRSSVWMKAIGEDYIDSAFVFAHRADPDALLYLNDYSVELQGKAKSMAFYNLAMRLKNAGIPIHGVGLQCHFSIGDVDSLALDKTMKMFEDQDLKCIITELDMGVPSTTTDNLREQARNYRVITDIMLNHDNCPHMVIWGLKDDDSWRSASNPLLFDAGLNKKPAYHGVRSALRHRDLVNTGLPAVSAEKVASNKAVYDLSGRRVDITTVKPGVYVMEGRKVVVR